MSQGLAVFMANVPTVLTERTLKAELSPFLDGLRIEDWTCEKPRDKRFGILTFLHQQDGQEFLRKHGEEPLLGVFHRGRPRAKARLKLLGSPVYCRQSDKGPDATLLRVLEMNAEERNKPSEAEEKPQTPGHVVFNMKELSCGHYDYPNEKLAYTPDIKWHVAQGIAKFARDTLIISFHHSLGQIRRELYDPNLLLELSST